MNFTFNNGGMQAEQVFQGTFSQLTISGPTRVADPDVRTRIERARTEIARAAEDGLVERIDADAMSVAVEQVATEADSPTPDRSRMESATARLRRLTTSVTAATALTEALHALLGSLGVS